MEPWPVVVGRLGDGRAVVSDRHALRMELTLGGVFGSAVSGDAVPSVLVAQWSGPTWLTGGAFGLEASVLAVAVCSTASLALWRLGRRPTS